MVSARFGGGFCWRGYDDGWRTRASSRLADVRAMLVRVRGMRYEAGSSGRSGRFDVAPT